MAGWKWYTDPTLQTEFGGTLTPVHRADFSDNPQDYVLYYGNIDDDPGDNQVQRKREATNPGTNQIALSIVDANVGSGHEADEISLAMTAAGLDTAVAGASLDLGTELLSGVSQAVEVHVRIENAVSNVGTSTELSIHKVDTIDSAVPQE